MAIWVILHVKYPNFMYVYFPVYGRLGYLNLGCKTSGKELEFGLDQL